MEAPISISSRYRPNIAHVLINRSSSEDGHLQQVGLAAEERREAMAVIDLTATASPKPKRGRPRTTSIGVAKGAKKPPKCMHFSLKVYSDALK